MSRSVTLGATTQPEFAINDFEPLHGPDGDTLTFTIRYRSRGTSSSISDD